MEVMRVDGYESAREAASRMGFNYAYLTFKLRRGDVPGAERWLNRWLVPVEVTREMIECPRGRPRKGS